MGSAFVERGGWWVVGQSVLFVAIISLGFCGSGAWANPAIAVPGVAALALGALCGIAGTIALGRNLTPFPRPASKARLVQTGVYGLMRHPLYTAVFCAAMGWALVRGSGPALAAALLLGPFLDAKARREERWLRKKFPEYAAYAARVRRFIPGIY